jgi:hypothetical protein
MRKLKKFKRFDKGGLTDSSGNPVLSGDGTPIQTMEDTETPEEKYAKRREGYENIKNFFMGRRSKDEPSAPIEERQPPKKAAEEDKAPAKTPAKPAVTASVTKPQVSSAPPTPAEASSPAQSTAVNRGETSYDYPTQRGSSNRDDYEGGASPTSGGQTFKRAAPKAGTAKAGPAKPPKAAEKTPDAGKTPPSVKAASPDDIPGTDVKTPYKGEKIDNSNLAAKQFGQSMLGAFPALRGASAGIRGAMGLGRMFESSSKPKEAPRTEPTLAPSTSTSASSTPASSTTPRGGDPRAAANRRAAESETKEPPTRVDPRAAANRRAAESEGKETPKEAPKAEPKVETKSGAIQPTGKGPSEAGRKLMQGAGRGKPQTLKEKAIEEINASRAATKDTRGPLSETKGAIKPTGKGPSEAGKEMMENAGRGKATGPERASLKEQAKEAINAQRARDKDPRGPITEGSRSARPARPESKPIKPTGAGPSEAGKKLMERAKNQSSTILEKERKPDLMMQEYISGREAARNRIKDLPDDGLSVPRYEMKKGGKIPAFKKGGLVGRADGCAIRGKTKGRMV